MCFKCMWNYIEKIHADNYKEIRVDIDRRVDKRKHLWDKNQGNTWQPQGTAMSVLLSNAHWSTLVVVVLNLKSPRAVTTPEWHLMSKFHSNHFPAEVSTVKRYKLLWNEALDADVGHACKIKDSIRAIALTRFRNYADLYNICVWQLLRRYNF